MASRRDACTDACLRHILAGILDADLTRWTGAGPDTAAVFAMIVDGAIFEVVAEGVGELGSTKTRPANAEPADVDIRAAVVVAHARVNRHEAAASRPREAEQQSQTAKYAATQQLRVFSQPSELSADRHRVSPSIVCLNFVGQGIAEFEPLCVPVRAMPGSPQ